MAAGGGSGGAGRRPIAAAGGSICYSHGRDLAPAGPAQPPQPRDQPQVRLRRSPHAAAAAAAAALTWSCGLPAGFLTAPSAGSRCTANQVHRSFSDHFSDLLFLGTVHGLAPPESGRELAGGGDGNGGRGRAGTRGRGAGRALALDWVSVDFTWQRTRQPPLLSSHDYIPVKRFRKEGGLARDFQGLEM
ncbi:hypothetical protein mRhiFer1_009423 [Rhinolophus ferrumequinum]|uniref:Uncharacterized protein n=1 Tax=Rhinolophus ferrumequinum TaxID=59479 RepID=A0A7J7RJ61_RHIFE|nr:hypothetical protein mRhiFer1_009423 [Rhinolophus ferrumequinum]